MRKTAAVIALGCLALFAGVARTEEKQKTEGSTRVKGTVNVKKESNNTYTIDIEVKTRKSGVSGEGKGVVEVQLIDSNFEPKNPIRVQKTVGADLSGSVEKSESKSVSGLPADKFNGLIWGIKASDSIGFPTSINDLKKFLKDEFGADVDIKDVIKDLGAGDVKAFGDVSIMRLP
jgi:hypothetical protein